MIGIEVVRLGEIARIKGGKRLPKGAELMPEKTEHAYIRVTDMSEKWSSYFTDHVYRTTCS
ncbi:MAG: hypothetical protein CG441_1313 [Methylococcaceae bacterium NSM2-1]|jgi:hypothetical protein|nr:MAG: hypothetical protein CG441_1313 [Methylococcaceae bacterium NSM2-1]